jgi:hypothetical protein
MIGRIIIFGYSISVYVGCAYIVHSLSLKRIIINVKSQLLHAFICCFKCGLLSLVCAVKLSDHIPLPPSPHGYGDIFHIDHLVVNVLVSCYYSCKFALMSYENLTPSRLQSGWRKRSEFHLL